MLTGQTVRVPDGARKTIFWATGEGKLIQYARAVSTGWTHRSSRRQHIAMPLDLTDLELETAARACRALAYQEEQAAKRMENPGMRGPVENTARRAAALAEKFERARAPARR
jgi:hypothetical protein